MQSKNENSIKVAKKEIINHYHISVFCDLFKSKPTNNMHKMDTEHFINKLSEIFEDAKPETIKPEKEYREIEGYSSLSVFLIIGMASEEYNVNLTADDFRKSETIEDLFLIVMSRK